MFKKLFAARRSQGYSALTTTTSEQYGSCDTPSSDQLNEGDEDVNESIDRDRGTFKRIPDSLPLSAWLITIVETCERFAFFGLFGPLQNYIQNDKNDPLRPGAIGLGQAGATRFNQLFFLWCYATPICGAIIADQYIGRLRTIIASSFFMIAGLIVLCLTSLPPSIEQGFSQTGLIVAFVLLGVGTGGIKPNVSSLLAEQYVPPEDNIRKLKNGESRILDYNLTMTRIFMIFFMCINLGSLSSLLTTSLERYVGFWAAFLLPTIVFCMVIITLLSTRHNYKTQTPKGSVIFDTFQVLRLALKNRGSLETAKPSSYQSGHGVPEKVTWDDAFVDEVQQALRACKVFLFFPFYWAAYSQMLTNFISQAATMETHGLPNDIVAAIDPISVLILVPLLDRFLYPCLARFNIILRPITRIAWGFVACGLAMLWAAGVQYTIYSAPPCYKHPRAYECLEGKVPNRVHIGIQIPAYVLIALSEILAAATGLEYAYLQAPPSMKSLVSAVMLSTAALGSVLAIAVTPLTMDPRLVLMYTILSIACFFLAAGFWYTFRTYDQGERQTVSSDLQNTEII